MSRVVTLLTSSFGVGGNIVVSCIFILLCLFGILVAVRGKWVMIWLVSFMLASIGIVAGAMAGLLIFNSFILMLICAIMGGTSMLLVGRYVKSIGYFISMFFLAFFISYVITSEMQITNTRITENTLLLFDLVVGLAVGLLSVIKSKFIVTSITSVSGGMITSISILVLLGSYFADWKMWLIAIAVSIFGFVMQIRR